MQCAAPAWLASGTKIGPCTPRWRTGLLCPSRQCGQFASQSLACIRLLQNRAKLTPFVIDAPSFAGRKGIRVIRPKPQSIDILIFSVCLRGGPGVAIRSSCYRQKSILATRAKFYRQHRIHLDEAGNHWIGVVTAGTLVADDGERLSAVFSSSMRRTEPRSTLSHAAIPTTSMGCGKQSKSTLIGRSAAHENRQFASLGLHPRVNSGGIVARMVRL